MIEKDLTAGNKMIHLLSLQGKMSYFISPEIPVDKSGALCMILPSLPTDAGEVTSGRNKKASSFCKGIDLR
jgi:hypothetical protein